jgi:hypothetical protein
MSGAGGIGGVEGVAEVERGKLWKGAEHKEGREEEPAAEDEVNEKKEETDGCELLRWCCVADEAAACAVRLPKRVFISPCAFAISSEVGGGRLRGGGGRGGGGEGGRYVGVLLGMRNELIKSPWSLLPLRFFSFGFVSELVGDTSAGVGEDASARERQRESRDERTVLLEAAEDREEVRQFSLPHWEELKPPSSSDGSIFLLFSPAPSSPLPLFICTSLVPRFSAFSSESPPVCSTRMSSSGFSSFVPPFLLPPLPLSFLPCFTSYISSFLPLSTIGPNLGLLLLFFGFAAGEGLYAISSPPSSPAPLSATL